VIVCGQPWFFVAYCSAWFWWSNIMQLKSMIVVVVLALVLLVRPSVQQKQNGDNDNKHCLVECADQFQVTEKECRNKSNVTGSFKPVWNAFIQCSIESRQTFDACRAECWRHRQMPGGQRESVNMAMLSSWRHTCYHRHIPCHRHTATTTAWCGVLKNMTSINCFFSVYFSFHFC